MGKIDRIILFKNAVETLGYFSGQMAETLRQEGMETFFVDCDRICESLAALPRFAAYGKTAVITFNFIGISGEEVFLQENGISIWEAYEPLYFNLLVDHPLYYHKKIQMLSSGMRKRMKLFCLDREHVAYVRRFYPDMEVHFLPTAGNVELAWNCDDHAGGHIGRADFLQSYRRRNYDLVFTANYVPFGELYQKIGMLETDYRIFYHEMLEDLIVDPGQSVHRVMERHLLQELCVVSEAEMAGAFADMALVDLAVRACFREKILSKLADAGVMIHLFGADWEKFRENRSLCRHPQNIIANGRQISSAECVRVMRNAKLSLNIMPWFKDGAHDRVFTAMLQGCVSVTDDSRYLREEFEDGKDLVFYSLKNIERLPDVVCGLLEDEERAALIAERGYRKAAMRHTWKKRAEELAGYLN